MKLTLVQPMSDGTYRVKELDVREKTLSLHETDEVFTNLEAAHAEATSRELTLVFASWNGNGEIWV